MQYDLKNRLDRERFQTRAMSLLAKGSIVELTEKAVRSLNQNNYLHLIIGAVALEAGVTLDYAKTEYYKRHVNGDLFIISKQDRLLGTDRQCLRSSADLTKEEMSVSIDRFKKWAAEMGIYLPDPDEREICAQISYEIEKNKQYL